MYSKNYSNSHINNHKKDNKNNNASIIVINLQVLINHSLLLLDISIVNHDKY